MKKCCISIDGEEPVSIEFPDELTDCFRRWCRYREISLDEFYVWIFRSVVGYITPHLEGTINEDMLELARAVWQEAIR